MGNPKSQVPNPKEFSNPNLQSCTETGTLGFDIWNFLGAWDLGLGTLA
jgi:hypothetical protein